MTNFFEHAIKIFVLTFFSVLIPELVIILGSAGAEVNFTSTVFIPIICAALSAALNATWNFLSKIFSKELEEVEAEVSDEL